MAVERYDYPPTGTTNSFVPTLDAEFAVSFEDYEESVLADQSSGTTEYRYDEGINVRIITRGYRNMSAADKTSFQAFKAAARGGLFKFTDYAAVEHTVSFALYKTRFTPKEGILWDWDVVMREQL